jgi:prophage antirepressor-like protein
MCPPLAAKDVPYALALAPTSPRRVEDKNQAKVFGFEGINVRGIVGENGKPWYVGVDVCAILGYADAYDAIKKHCKHPSRLQSGDSPDWRVLPKGMTIIPA